MKNKSVQLIGRFVSSSVILGINAFFTPGFSTDNILQVVICILVLSFLDFALSTYTNLYYHPYMKFILGSALCFAVLYFLQYNVIGYVFSFISIILGTIIYGLVDFMLPSEDFSKEKLK